MSQLETIYASITALLKEIITLDNNVLLVILVNKSGQLIDYAASSSFKSVIKNEDYIDGLAATIAAMYGATLATGLDFELGSAEIVLAEFSMGRLIIVACGEQAILSLVASKEAPLGSLRMLAKRYAQKIAELIPALFEKIDEEIKSLMHKPTESIRGLV